MANSKIRGITIEIGGDTTKLDKALGSVDKKVKGTQVELREVNKLLKIDPTNTEMLAQKQALLTDTISETKEKLDILRLADFIFRDEVAKAHLESAMSQYFAVLTNMRSVGVQGDGRTYDYTLALRSVTTTDFMTADWTRIPYDVLDRVSVRIVNEVPHINRIVYDITSKPPATIEWE